MSFGDALSSYFFNFANFSGRARRSEYWYSMLFVTLLNLVFSLIDAKALGGFNLLTGCIRLPIFIATLSVTVRRLHDTSKSGYWVLAPVLSFILIFMGALAGISSASADVAETFVIIGALIGICSSILIFVFLCIDSVPGANQYGSNPKGIGYDRRY